MPTFTKEEQIILRKAAAIRGRLGGRAGTALQNAARRENGKLGGRPRKKKRQ